jgi:hypothetical protein
MITTNFKHTVSSRPCTKNSWPNRLCRTKLERKEAHKGRSIVDAFRSGATTDVKNAMAARNIESR